MRILWVKAGGLVPPDVGGRIRSYHLLRQLARRHSVTFFTFYAKHSGDLHHELSSLFHRAICIPTEIPLSRSRRERLNYVRHALSPLPFSVSKYARPEIRERLRELLVNEDFDVVVSDFVISDAVVPRRISCPRIVFTHNVEAQIWRRHVENASSLFWKAVCWREYRNMKRFEDTCLALADHVLTVSQTDLDNFAATISREKMSVIPTGVDTEFFRPANAPTNGNELVFTGAMDWLPNEDAMCHFVHETLPLIQRQMPSVTLTIVGRCPSPRVQALASPAVRVTGRVDDIRPYVSNAALYIVPIRIGSGTRLKIFEAMAMGKAVLSTTIGAEGLPVERGREIEFADSPHEFAVKVIELLRCPQARTNLGLAARSLVEKQYSWVAVNEVFEATLARIVAQERLTRRGQPLLIRSQSEKSM